MGSGSFSVARGVYFSIIEGEGRAEKFILARSGRPVTGSVYLARKSSREMDSSSSVSS